jgi:serine/threonine-protein kinase PknK
MRRCPACSKIFDDAVAFCPHDGERLAAGGDLRGAVVGDKYRLDDLVGEGGMGKVYRATQLRLDRQVAVKVISSRDATAAAVRRFTREAIAVARLRHPNIVAIYDFDVAPGVGLYIAMELLDGFPLRDKLEGGQRLAPERAVALLSQACEGVGAAHRAGVVHRDLKPDNLFVDTGTGAEIVKVLDFGIARLADDSGVSVTRPGAWIGTPLYMAPEQCEGEATDARADVYTLGCVAYELLTGRTPFAGLSLTALLHAHVYETPEPPSRLAPDVPPDLEAVVLRALAKDPADRFPTAAELGRALEGEAPPPAIAATIAEAPPDVSRPETQHNLPADASRFVGRENDLAVARRALESSRVVTLAGPGGIGKTRLALEVARASLGAFPDGVWFVPLAPLADPSLVAAAVASTVRVPDASDRDPATALAEHFRARRALLVLDNCEHVVALAAALVAELVAACPRLSVLATSQQRLGVAGEVVSRVAPLETPAEGASTGEASATESVRLFVERARLADPAFELTPATAAPVAAICRRLEGIPLAIELAAARVGLLTPAEIAARLDDRFRLLTTGDRSAPERHRTLRAAVEWSYNLLPAGERDLFATLSVFAGSFSLEAVEAVAGRPDALDRLASLVDRSLVTVSRAGEETRYRLLETVRELARERLREAGAEPEARAAHFAWALALAERASETLYTPEQGAWFDRLEREHDNLRAALRRGLGEHDSALDVLRLATFLFRFWLVRGHWVEGRRWLEEALAAVGASETAERARALDRLATFEDKLGDHARSRALYEESLALWRALGERRGIAGTLHNLSIAVRALGDYESAGPLLEESIAINRELGNHRGAFLSTNSLGDVALANGDHERARECFEACRAFFASLGDRNGEAMALHNLAYVDLRLGRLDLAARWIDEALAAAHEVGDRQLDAAATNLSAKLALLRGQYDEAASCAAASIASYRELEDLGGAIEALETAACIAASSGDARRAVELFAASDALRRAHNHPRPSYMRDELAPYLREARRALGAAASDVAALGAALDLDAALGRAVTRGQTSANRRQTPVRRTDV